MTESLYSNKRRESHVDKREVEIEDKIKYVQIKHKLDDIVEELRKIKGKRIVGTRIGESGFDLIFDDGSELEVYCLGLWGIIVQDPQDQF